MIEELKGGGRREKKRVIEGAMKEEGRKGDSERKGGRERKRGG